MTEEGINYKKQHGIYYVKLSRSEVEEFIKGASFLDNIKPSLSVFARRKVMTHRVADKAEVVVDCSPDIKLEQKVDFSGIDFSNADISGVKFSGVNMQGCKFENTVLDSADFKGAILDRAVFKNCRAKEAIFVQAKLNNVIIDNSDFRAAFLTESETNELEINNHSNLDQAVIKNVNWHDVIIKDSSLRSTQLDNAKIEKAIIMDSDFSNCSMQNAKMPHAELTNVKLNNVDANGINLHAAVIKSNCQLKNVNFSAADLTYVDLNGCTISNTNLTTANLLKANLEGASISRERHDKRWYQPSSETLIKSTVGASKVVVGTSKVVTSGAKFTKNMFSKLWGSSAPVPQEAEVAQNNVSQQSNSQHYNNIVNTLTSTRLIAEDLTQARAFIDNITKVVAGLFNQDYFFPRANNRRDLVAQVEKAHAKGYIDDTYKEGFLWRIEQNPPKKKSSDYYQAEHKKFTHYMLQGRVEQLAKEGILSPQEQEELNKQLRDQTGQFEERVNQQLEKKILIKSAEKLKPLLHVLSDPKLFEITQLLGSGQNREQTLAIVDSLKENIGLITQKLKIDNPIAGLVIEDTLLQYVGIAPSIVSLIIPMMKYEQEFEVILSGLQDMFRESRGVDPSQKAKSPDQTMNAIRAICTLLQKDPELRRSFSEEIEKMTKVLASIFASQIQSIGLEEDFINKLTSFSTKLAQAENSEIFGLFATVIAVIQDPKSALESIVQAKDFNQLKNIVQKVLPNFIKNQNADIRSLIEQFLMRTTKGSEINNLIADALGLNTTKSLELQESYLGILESAVRIAGVEMNNQDECLELVSLGRSILFANNDTVYQYQSWRVVLAGMKLFSQKNVRDIISQALPKIFAATNGVLGAKLQSFRLSQEFAVQAVDLVAKVVASQEMGEILEFAHEILSSDKVYNTIGTLGGMLIQGIIKARGDYPKLGKLIVDSIRDEEKYNSLKDVIRTSLPSLLSSNKDNINALIGEFLKNTSMGQAINNQIAGVLGIDTSSSLKLRDGYREVASSMLQIAGVVMNHKTDFMLLMDYGRKLLTGDKVDMSDHLQAIASGVKLLKQQDVRMAIRQHLPKIFAATNGVLGAKIEAMGLSHKFAEQSVDLVAKVVASEEMGEILEFAHEILISNKVGKMTEILKTMLIQKIIEARGDYPKLGQLIVDSIRDEEKYNQLKDVIHTSLPSLLSSNKDNINALIGEFLKNTSMGQAINNQIAGVLGIDASSSLKLQDGYMEVASSMLQIAGVVMNHKTDFMLLMDYGRKLLTGDKVDMSDSLQAIASGVKLLKQQDVRRAISQELPKIFAATNGVLAAKIEAMGLSHKFAEQSVDLVAKVVASEEMGKILKFVDILLTVSIYLETDKKGMQQLIKSIRAGDYKAGFQGFVALVGNAGKYKELRALVQGTLPALIQHNKEQIVPLMEEFINNTDLGKRINIDVNDILEIASKKNKNFLDLAKYWAEGSYSGILKETVKLLTSPMVAGFLLEIAGKATWSYLFESKKEEEKLVQGQENKVFPQEKPAAQDVSETTTVVDVSSSKLTKEQLALDPNTVSKIAKMQGKKVPVENKVRYRKKLLGNEVQDVQARDRVKQFAKDDLLLPDRRSTLRRFASYTEQVRKEEQIVNPEGIVKK